MNQRNRFAEIINVLLLLDICAYGMQERMVGEGWSLIGTTQSGEVLSPNGLCAVCLEDNAVCFKNFQTGETRSIPVQFDVRDENIEQVLFNEHGFPHILRVDHRHLLHYDEMQKQFNLLCNDGGRICEPSYFHDMQHIHCLKAGIENLNVDLYRYHIATGNKELVHQGKQSFSTMYCDGNNYVVHAGNIYYLDKNLDRLRIYNVSLQKNILEIPYRNRQIVCTLDKRYIVSQMDDQINAIYCVQTGELVESCAISCDGLKGYYMYDPENHRLMMREISQSTLGYHPMHFIDIASSTRTKREIGCKYFAEATTDFSKILIYHPYSSVYLYNSNPEDAKEPITGGTKIFTKDNICGARFAGDNHNRVIVTIAPDMHGMDQDSKHIHEYVIERNMLVKSALKAVRAHSGVGSSSSSQ